MRLLVLTSHPIQYQAPLFRDLARRLDLLVLFAHRATAEDQSRAGFGVGFEWDVDLTSGYESRFLVNRARRPGLDHPMGTDCPEIRDIVTDWAPDALLVMGWQHRAYWQAVLAARRAGIPVLVRGESQLATPRSVLLKLAKEGVYRVLLRAFDGFLYIGARNRQYLEHYGVGDDRLFFSPYSVDNVWFRSRARAVDVEVLRRSLGLQENRRVVLFCGKLVPKKRPLDVVRAIGCLSLSDRPSLLVVGSGPLESEMRRQAALASIDVRFLGFQNQSELPRWYTLADLLVLPSDGGETWGLVVNESMACGTPAVVSDAVGCGPDLVERGRTGDIFALGNIEELATKIREAVHLKRNPAVSTALEQKMEVYSIERSAAGVTEALDTIIRKKS